MSFVAPLFLIAALAAILPILIHLIHRQKAKEIPFPTLRFLNLSVQRTRRRKYLDDALLLALRVALLALLALGLAGPALNSLRNLLGGNQPAAAVIILDNSGSMDTLSEPPSTRRFETARDLATTILDQLDDTDAAALLLTGGTPSTAQGRFFRSHTPLRQELAAARVFPEPADLAARLQQAHELLDTLEASRREIYILTDNQALSWNNLDPRRLDQNPTAKLPPVIVVDTRGQPLLNASLRNLQLQSPAPVAGAPVIARAEVSNPTTVDQQKHFELRLDGTQLALSPTLTLPAGQAVTHEFRFTIDDPGIHNGQILLVEDDASSLDNRLFFALNVDPAISLAIIKPRQHEIPQADDAFYLERALASQGTRLTTLTPDQITPAALAGQAAAFCVNLPTLDADAAQTLATYAQNGGHLVWIAGPNVDPDSYNQMNQQASGQLLPAPLGPLRVPAPGATQSWSIASLDPTHPALATLTEPPSLYQTVLVFQLIPVAPEPDARILATLDDGQPLFVEKALGAGSTLWLGAAAREDWTNLPLKPLFLPLVSRLAFHLAGSLSGQSQSLAGAPLTIPLSNPGAEVEAVRPGGEVLRVKPSEPTATSLKYIDTHEPGLYLFREISASPPRTHAFAVNGDPDENTDTPIPPAELQQRFGPQTLALCASPAELAETTRRLREGTPLRDALLALVLAALVIEAFFANRRRALPPGQHLQQPPSALASEQPLTDRLVLGDDHVILLGDDR